VPLSCPAACFCSMTVQFWVWSMYDAFRGGKSGVRPLSGAQLAAESTRSGYYTCVPNKIKF